MLYMLAVSVRQQWASKG